MKKFRALSLMMAAWMSLSMAACAKPDTDAAVENTENVAFTATPSQKEILVEMEDGSKQKLELAIDKKLYDPTMMIVDDYNFDGYKDIAFPADYNEHNKIYQLWLYNAKTGSFEENVTFRNTYNPTLDAEHSVVNSVMYTNPVTTSYSKYEWRDGELFLLYLKSESQDDDGKDMVSEWAYDEEEGQLKPIEPESKPASEE